MKQGMHLVNKEKGFTLVELVVVLSLFMVIVSVTVDIFISIVRQQRNILAQQELLSQVSYVQEYMSRAIRSATLDASGECTTGPPGYIYFLTHLDPVDGFYKGIKFITKDNICQEFFLDPADGILKEIKNSGTPQNILSSKFNVQFMKFIINGDKALIGASGSDLIQPRVSFSLDIQDSANGIAQERIFQTTVSRRNLNIE